MSDGNEEPLAVLRCFAICHASDCFTQDLIFFLTEFHFLSFNLALFLGEIILLSLVKLVMSTVAKSAAGPNADSLVKVIWKFPWESPYSFLHI